MFSAGECQCDEPETEGTQKVAASRPADEGPRCASSSGHGDPVGFSSVEFSSLSSSLLLKYIRVRVSLDWIILINSELSSLLV